MLLFGLIIVLLITISCNSGIQQTVDLSNSPIVAEVKLTATGDSVVVCNMDLVTDTIDFPMGLLLSNLELVKLDDGENASIKNVSLQAVSSNYIGLYSFYGGIKLFNREGHFISKISGKGQGPNDYSYGPSDMLIDESNDCLYFTEPGMEKLMVFDLKGNPKKPIPLFPFNNLEGHYNTHMSFCFDHEHNILKIAHIPFSSEEPAYWIQDEEGNLVQWVAGKHLASNRDFSNTLANMQNTSENDYSIGYWFDERVDSLYHYDEIKNRMKPVFTANLDCITKYHKYIELFEYYY